MADVSLFDKIRIGIAAPGDIRSWSFRNGATRDHRLPQVAVEEHWTRDEMLGNLCQKGGMEAGCWRAGAKLSTFQADVFKEGDFR